ncbi:MAG: CRISPR-associated protein Cas4 [bacterium]|nr:CRISPR-associated protein Cas4 [bacterium]
MMENKEFDISDLHVTGTEVAYYIVCKRKLWLFSHNIRMEEFSEFVQLGKHISETTFKREKEVQLLDTVSIDFLKIGQDVQVREVKKSRAIEEAHLWQVKFYIYFLRKLGVSCSAGYIHYPKLMKRIKVDFSESDEREIEEAISKIQEVKSQKSIPPVVRKPYCSGCAYNLFCYVR